MRHAREASTLPNFSAMTDLFVPGTPQQSRFATEGRGFFILHFDAYLQQMPTTSVNLI